jgi:formylglycine-generating enzyme required for sulfatase activity
MAGNVWEWVFDWYGNYDLKNNINPVGAVSGEFKVIKGGSWSNHTLPTYLRVSNRGQNKPDNANNETGFRCVFTN